MEDGAMPCLQYMCFGNCFQLRALPDGLQYMTTLKKLILYPIHGDLARRLSPNGGPENYKVKHTPQVQFYEQLNRMNRMEVWHFRADFHTKIELREIISIVSCIILKFFPNFIIY